MSAIELGGVWCPIQIQTSVDFLSELTHSATPKYLDATTTLAGQTLLNTRNFNLAIPIWVLHCWWFDKSTRMKHRSYHNHTRLCQDWICPIFNFITSNNDAKHEALLAGLRLANDMGAKQIFINSDCQLVMNQVMTNFASKCASMTAYLSATHQQLQKFSANEIRQILRA